jgi:mono/diheme cytochrome c family protein
VELDTPKKNETLTSSSDPGKGKSVYYANCTSCHNYNPKKTGSIGPDVYGSSIELLKNKVLYGKYPKNYQAKRTRGIMPLYPHLNKQISNLHAFLNSPSN